jgi:hypothetical protein
VEPHLDIGWEEENVKVTGALRWTRIHVARSWPRVMTIHPEAATLGNLGVRLATARISHAIRGMTGMNVRLSKASVPWQIVQGERRCGLMRVKELAQTTVVRPITHIVVATLGDAKPTLVQVAGLR